MVTFTDFVLVAPISSIALYNGDYRHRGCCLVEGGQPWIERLVGVVIVIERGDDPPLLVFLALRLVQYR